MTDPTKRLYFKDPYRMEFEATILDKTRFKGKPAVILDQTCFYPESGGQPADTGMLGGRRIVDVQEQEDRILHVLDEDIPDAEVHGTVDWTTRFDHMQQHAGQHILSQAFLDLLGAKTLSFHLGKVASTLEMDLRDIDEEGLQRVEYLANTVVFENREIKSYFVGEDDLSQVPLRRPPKKKGEIRVVEVSDFDHSACGGTHPRRSGEIGLIKILKWDRIRDNLRFEFVCGQRALRDYSLKHDILRRIAVRFTVAEADALDSVEKLLAELKTIKKEMKTLREKQLAEEADKLIEKTDGLVIVEIAKDLTPADAKSLALNIIKKGDFVVLMGLDLKDRVHLIFACSEDLELDVRELIPIVSPLVDGGGGGRPSFVEMSGRVRSKLSEAMERAAEFMRAKVNT